MSGNSGPTKIHCETSGNSENADTPPKGAAGRRRFPSKKKNDLLLDIEEESSYIYGPLRVVIPIHGYSGSGFFSQVFFEK